MKVSTSSTYAVELTRDELVQLANALDSFILEARGRALLETLDQAHMVRDLWNFLEDLR
jgi:DNA-binding protein